MKTFIIAISLSLLPAALTAEELLRTVSFSEMSEARALHAGELTDADTLTVSATPGTRFQLLVELANPNIRSAVYALKGMVRYQDVEGDGYLQLDNHFGANGTYYTRSLAMAGPLGKLSGSSDWRPFILPFNATSGDPEHGTALFPEKLSLGIFLPGSGTVSVRGIGLYQYAPGENPLQPAGQWLSARNASLLGAIGGSLLGIWGALLGVMSARGRARRFVLGSTTTLLIIGIISLGSGIAALAASQPYAVYFPFLLIGIILVTVFGALRRNLVQRYEQFELKKMQSMDA